MSQGNPYQSPQAAWDSYAPFAADAKADERAAFIQRTYLHLLGAVVAFVALEAALFTLVPAETLTKMTMLMVGGWSWLIVLGAFMGVSWLARSWANSSTSVGMQYAGLGLYVVAQAVLFVPLLCIAMFYTHGNVLMPAAVLTLFIFGGLTAITFITKADFSYMGSYLMWGGIAAMGIIVFGIFFGFSLGFWFSAAMVLLASGYILYDTSNVLHRYHTDQHVAASLALFASVALLFWYVLQILMAVNRR